MSRWPPSSQQVPPKLHCSSPSAMSPLCSLQFVASLCAGLRENKGRHGGFFRSLLSSPSWNMKILRMGSVIHCCSPETQTLMHASPSPTHLKHGQCRDLWESCHLYSACRTSAWNLWEDPGISGAERTTNLSERSIEPLQIAITVLNTE